jgi:hypothetical protein
MFGIAYTVTAASQNDTQPATDYDAKSATVSNLKTAT